MKRHIARHVLIAMTISPGSRFIEDRVATRPDSSWSGRPQIKRSHLTAAAS